MAGIMLSSTLAAVIVWDKNKHVFSIKEGFRYLDDLDDLECHLLDTGHSALEEYHEPIAQRPRTFCPAPMYYCNLARFHPGRAHARKEHRSKARDDLTDFKTIWN